MTHAPGPALDAAVERLYDAFLDYPAYGPDGFCRACLYLRQDTGGEVPCDNADPERAALATWPLRRLGVPELTYLVDLFHAQAVRLDERKRYLPRLFDLAVHALRPAPTAWLGELRAAGWEAWPAPEREAVAAALAAWWEATIATFPGPYAPLGAADVSGWDFGVVGYPVVGAAGELLRGLAAATDELEPFLAAWLPPGEEPPLPRLQHLVDFLAEEGVAGAHASLRGTWAPEPKRRIVAWLARPELGEALERAVARHYDAPAAEGLAAGHDFLARLRAVARPG